MDSNTNPVFPAFVFQRRRHVEIEAGFILAGQLFVGASKGMKPKKVKRLAFEIIRNLTGFAQSGQWPDDRDMLFGWPDPKPPNAVDVDDAALMAAWAKGCTVIAVRVDPHSDGKMRLDSEALLQAGVIKRH